MSSETTFENPAFEPDDIDIDPDEDIDPNNHDDDAVQQTLSQTQPFNPGQASTPYHQWEVQTMQQEHEGLPSYDVETPLLAQNQQQKQWDALTSIFPDASATNLETSYSKEGRLQVKMVGYGKKLYDLFTNDRSGKQQLNPKLSKEITKSLGERAEQILLEDRNTIQDQRQRLAEAEKQQREAEAIASEREKEKLEMENLKQKIGKTQARIEALQDEHGSNLESESELRRLKLLKKNRQTEYENKKKEVAALEKQAKNKQKAEEKVSRERAKLDEIVKKRNLIEERLNSNKPLEDLNEREAELRQQNAEDQAIIDDANATSSEKEAARDRIEERIEELARLQTQITEREEAMPLRERIKDIFKKHGVTVTAIFVAAGVTIGAVVRAITKGLKATGKAMANGLKEIGAKLGSLLPGLIGQVAHFLFNTAAKAVGFLADHTWLIILAVVAFLFEKYIKKRR